MYYILMHISKTFETVMQCLHTWKRGMFWLTQLKLNSERENPLLMMCKRCFRLQPMKNFWSLRPPAHTLHSASLRPGRLFLPQPCFNVCQKSPVPSTHFDSVCQTFVIFGCFCLTFQTRFKRKMHYAKRNYLVLPWWLSWRQKRVQ